MTDYGVDISAPDGDLDPYFRLVSGTELLQQALYRAVTTPSGSLFWAPDRGIDLASYLEDGLSTAEASRLGGLVAAQFERDERVLSASVEVTLSIETQSLRVSCEIDTADGPFDLVFSVTEAATRLLNV